jgi:hypothetical protein
MAIAHHVNPRFCFLDTEMMLEDYESKRGVSTLFLRLSIAFEIRARVASRMAAANQTAIFEQAVAMDRRLLFSHV